MVLRLARSSIGCLTVGLAVFVGLPSSLAAQPPAAPGGRAISVRAISVAAVGDDVVVTIDADGPLPAPTVGAVDNPPRVFLDLAGVRTKAPAATPSSDPRIRRVRAALHSAQPLVTRVVVDLAAMQPNRIEQGPTQIKVVIGGSAAAGTFAPVATTSAPAARTSRGTADRGRPIPLVPPLPDPPPPTRSEIEAAPALPPPVPPPDSASASTPPAPNTSYKPLPMPPSLRDVEKYRAQVLGTLDRFRLQLPALETLEDREPRTTESLELASLEIDRLRQELLAIKAPDSLRVQHDLLLQSSRLALMAIRLRGEALRSGDSTVMRNAASAAAGAVMMFERACAEVGCIVDRRP